MFERQKFIRGDVFRLAAGRVLSASIPLLMAALIGALAATDVHAESIVADHGWVLLDVALATESNEHPPVLLPPPGRYVFSRGDYVLLRAYDQQREPLSVHWTEGEDEAAQYLLLKLDGDTSIAVSPQSAPAETQSQEDIPWFDVPEKHGVYAFLSGGALCGWFAAKRHKDHGAGIAYLTHAGYPDAPLWRGPALDLEHIFTGSADDDHRSMFTPRTDPMRFRPDGPGSVRVQWPAETASWNLDCEMHYAITGGDSIDMAFEVIPRDDAFALDYLVFMWASYHHRFAAPAIHFQGMDQEQRGWMRFGPSEVENGSNGGTIAHKNAPALPFDKGLQNFNLYTLDHIVFDAPFYYGLLDPAMPDEQTDQLVELRPKEAGEGLLAYLLMFSKREPMRFTLWNWGSPPNASAWDWQYVLLNPEKDERRSYRARLQIAPYQGEDRIKRLFEQWVKHPETDAHTTQALDKQAWTAIPHIFGPSNVSLAGSVISGTAARAQSVGDHERAELLYRRALMIDPGNLQYKTALAETLEQRNDPALALDYYADVLSQNPEDNYAAYRADMLLRQDDFADRQGAFWRALYEQHPQAVLPARRLGAVLYDTESFEEARKILEPLAVRHPEDVQTRFHLGSALLFCDDLDKGLGLLNDAADVESDLRPSVGAVLSRRAGQAQREGDLRLAERLYRKALEMEPGNLWPYVHLGETLEAAGDLAGAQREYRTVLKKEPESPVTAARFQALCERLKTAEENGPDTTCLDFWSGLRRSHPDAVIPRLYLGKTLETAGRPEEARALYESIIKNQPENTEALISLGLLEIRAGTLETGVDALDRALRQDSSLGGRLGQELAVVAGDLLKEGDDESAIHLYTLAMICDPDNLAHRVALGRAYEQQNNWEAAARAYRQVLQKAPDSPQTAGQLHDVFVRTNTLEEARQFWRRLSETYPTATIPFLYLGLTCKEMGEPEAAQTAYASGLALNPDYPDLLLQSGLLDIEQGRMDKGVESVRKAVLKNDTIEHRANEQLVELVERRLRQEHYETVVQLCRAALAIAPGDLRFMVLLGEAYASMGDWQAALDTYQTVLMEYPDSPVTAERMHTILVRHADRAASARVWKEIMEKHPDAQIPAEYYERTGNDS